MLQRNARYSIWNAVAAAVAMNLTAPYIGIFAVKLGADNLQLGYLSAWPQVVSVVAVLGLAAAVARSAQKQRLIAFIFLIGRAGALGAAAVPWFPESLRVWALIAFWVLAMLPNTAGNSALQSFLADVFPQGERGRVLASRQSWATGAGMVVVLISGWLLDHLFDYPVGYQVMFGLSFLAAVLEVLFFIRLKEPEESGSGTGDVSGAAVPTGFRSYLEVFRAKPYLLFLVCSIPFHFTWQMAWPIFTRFQVTDLGANNTWMSLIAVANSSVAMVGYRIWAKWAEKRGNIRTVGLAALYLAWAPFLISLAPSVQWLVVINLIVGFGVAGVVLLVLNTLLDIAPQQGRPVYVAVHAALVSVSASVAPMVGALMMEMLPIRVALRLTTLLRLITGFSFFLLPYYLRRMGQGTTCLPSNPTNSKQAPAM